MRMWAAVLVAISGMGLAGMAGGAPPEGAAGPSTMQSSAELIARFEAKWRLVMQNILGWDAEAVGRYRDAHAGLSSATLLRALAAGTWGEAAGVLEAARSGGEGQWRAKALSLDGIRPEDGGDEQLAAAHRWILKTAVPVPIRYLFVPTTPCTVFDTRYATDPIAAGIISDGVTRKFNVFGLMSDPGWNFTSQGGSPYCPNPTPNGYAPFAAMMTVYVSDATANGWLTFYQDGAPDPSQETISVYYSPGPTRTQTVVSKLGRPIYMLFEHDIAVTSRYGSAHASASVTGYFVRQNERQLECLEGTAVSQVLPVSGGTTFSVLASTCPAGYRIASTSCTATGSTGGGNLMLTGSGVAGPGSGACSGYHAGAASVTVTNTPWCCRVYIDTAYY